MNPSSSEKPYPPSDWWHDGTDATTTRNELLEKWRRLAPPFDGDGKSYADELNGWSREFGGTGWVATDYHRSLPTLLTSPRLATPEADGWNAVTALLVDYLDTFGRYTASWTTTLWELRPRRGLTRQTRDGLRTIARRGPSAVRTGMTRPADSVIATRAAADAFLAALVARRPADQATALLAYAAGLDAYCAGSAMAEGPDGPTETLEAHRSEIASLLPETPMPAPRDDDRAAERTAIANDVLLDTLDPRLLSPRFAEHLGEAWARVVRTCVNRLADGRPLDGPERYLAKRLKDVEAEYYRGLARTGRHVVPLADQEPKPRDDGPGDLVTEARLILQPHAATDWATAVAVGVLAGDGLGMTASELRNHIAERWQTDRPERLTRRGATNAVIHVLRAAIERARDEAA